jgi:hypothetical protein
MKRLIQILSIAGIWAAAALAQNGNVTLPQDSAPDKLDVSKYPAPAQAGYKLLESKCAKCHTPARPLNTLMKRDEWERYVKRMMHKPNSGISDSQGKQIFEFLVYDQTERKDKNPKAFFPALSDEEIAKLKGQTSH